MPKQFNRIAILGLGLIGGSLAMAIKQARGETVEVVGFNRTAAVAEEALNAGAIDRAEDDLKAAVSGADLVIIAVPVMAMREIMQAIAGHLSEGTVVSDAGSTKAQVMAWAQKLLPTHVDFIGGHPMAGREKAGFAAATADLFQGAVYCLTPLPRTLPESTTSLKELAMAVGAKPLVLGADEHDLMVGGISHLPLIASAALIGAASKHRRWPQMSELAASGFRDTTRLASGEPTMGRDMLISNGQMVGWLERFIRELESYQRLLKARDANALGGKLTEARTIRESLRQKKGWP
jgi:prephenate dehydrogenase